MVFFFLFKDGLIIDVNLYFMVSTQCVLKFDKRLITEVADGESQHV